jgi:hypothetical protein
MKFLTILLILVLSTSAAIHGQLVINEGSNKNATVLLDEDGEYKDWIELYNADSETINLEGYSLTDDSTQPAQWVFPYYPLQPGQYLVVFCSSKNRFAAAPATQFHTSYAFTPQIGWNNHAMQEAFVWDGVSNLLLNTCSYWSGGYTSNSVFNQTSTDYVASVSSFVDGGDYACNAQYGEISNLRPVLRINDIVVGENTAQNCNTCYPAPYGNWYFSARMQTLYRADDLLAAGLTAGPIDSLAFDVAYTDPTYYDYVSIQLTTAGQSELDFEFINTNGSFFHTNFGLSGTGETVYLFSPAGEMTDSLNIALQSLDASTGNYPDAGELNVLFAVPTPGSSNNSAEPAEGYTLEPAFTVTPGFYNVPQSVTILNPNGPQSTVRFTTDGSEPQSNSALYTGNPILIDSTTVLKARAFEPNRIPGAAAVGSYFINVNHITPVISISTANTNLYGPEGMFDNPFSDWLKSGFVEYFDSTDAHNLLISQYTGMIMDGGAGGSRAQPQRSFRLKLADGIFGETPFEHQVIPTLPYRQQYSDFYLRNGSNQYLALQYKDAAQVRMMSEGTHNYYSAWRPVTVYINGQYHGLYELRDKFNAEKFEIQDNASDEGMDILSLSYYYGGVLRGVEGDPQHYWDDWNTVSQFDVNAADYVEQIGNYYDLDNYTDYVIGESFMSNVDWPWNNIKIYRSDATDFKWRFALQDLELGLGPNSWTDCTTNHIEWLFGNTAGNPFTAPWYNMMQHDDYRLHFVNRFADLLNTSYRSERLVEIADYHYNMVIDEMPNYMARWGDPNNVDGYVQWFTDNHNIFRDQVACRPEQVRYHIETYFGYQGQSEVTLQVNPPQAGRIQINTIIPDSLPWNGIYFNGAPVTVTAIANPGYVFNYWSADSLLQSQWHNDSLVINMITDDVLTANFIGAPQPMKLMISEVNYNDDASAPAGDWLELHNDGNGTVNLTGWSLTNDVNMPRFEFPAGTYVAPHQYLVVAHNLEQFQSLYPDVTNAIGNFDFALPANGGTIRLLDHRDSVLREIHYSDSLPWPMVADGGSRTLEFMENSTPQDDAANWFAGCVLGSPGEGFSPCINPIVFSEINYASAPTSDAGDWIELRNVSSETQDISSWTLRDEQDNSAYLIPDNTILAPGEMIVLCKSTALFDGVYTGVENRAGDFTFGFDDNGELIRLYDEAGKINFSIYYQSNAPWPIEANAQGYTLELADSSADVNNGENWFAGCLLGSPGAYYIPCGPDAVDEADGSLVLQLFPNPAKHTLTILLPSESTSHIHLTLSDLNGKVMHNAYVTQNEPLQLNIAEYASGMYVLTLHTDTRTWHQRWIKE